MSEPEARTETSATGSSETAAAVPAPSPAPEAVPAPREEPARSDPATSVLVALIGERRACRGAARALANQGARVRVLCADREEIDAIRSGLRDGTGALSDQQLALVTPILGRLESDTDLGHLLDGATGVALLSPVGSEGRTWRPATHAEDVRSVLESVSNRRISRLVYLSSVNASLKLPIRCLREAAEAEKLIEKAGCLDFLLQIGRAHV